MDGSEYDGQTGEIRIGVPPPMAPEIARAIIAVKKQVKQLGADDRNDHGKYNFVSVDKFYERIGKLMAEAGLALLINESSAEVRASDKTGNPWLFVEYDLAFMHESGALSTPLHRSCALPINGPQTYGAAQSYIEKQFLRQVFKIPTGENDADATAQDDVPGPSGGRTAPGSTGGGRSAPPRQQAAAAPSAARDEATKRHTEIKNEIDATMTVPDLDAIPKMLAWQACREWIVKAECEKGLEPDKAAENAEMALGMLLTRIEKRKAMLTADAGGYR